MPPLGIQPSVSQSSTELSVSPETGPPLPPAAGGVDRPQGASGVDSANPPRSAVGTFHDEVLAYFLSQMWYDLIFVHVLRLRPRPFCCPEMDSEAEAVLLKQVLQRCADGQQIIRCHHINGRLWAVVPGLLLLFGVLEVWWLQRKVAPRHPHAVTLTVTVMLNPNPN